MSDEPTSTQDNDKEPIPPERWVFWPSFDFSYLSRPTPLYLDEEGNVVPGGLVPGGDDLGR